jgi:hypothetical protein
MTEVSQLARNPISGSKPTSVAAMPSHITIDLESSAETLVAELSAIVKIVDHASAAGILARNCLALALAMQNDLSAYADPLH